MILLLLQTKTFIPSLAVLLFFKDDLDFPDCANENNLSTKLFAQKPWKFHHKVDVKGKLISCESNRQDFYEYAVSRHTRSNGRSTPHLVEANDKTQPCAKNYHFPLWGARRVHFGKQVLRFTIFSSYINWNDQINFYKLILRKEESAVRDDFCFFQLNLNGNTVVQLGLKKLPPSVTPQPLTSSILQFKVKNVGLLVPVLPNVCNPISEMRWKTLDYDGNTVLFQIHPSSNLNVGSSFVKRIFPDQHVGSFGSDKKERLTSRRSKIPQNIPSLPTLQATPENGSDETDCLGNQTFSKDTETNLTTISSESRGSDLENSFEKSPPNDQTVYFQTNTRRSSHSSSCTSTSEYQSARGTSPESHGVVTPVRAETTKNNFSRKECRTPTNNFEKSSTKKNLLLSLTKDKGFYV